MNIHRSDFLLPLIMISLWSCTAVKSEQEAREQFEIVKIEAEDMKLTSAEILVADSTSGGKVIKLLSEDAVAETTLNLPSGSYVMNARLLSSDEFSDGFYLLVNDKVQRISNYHFDRWVYGMKFIVFDSDGENPINIQIRSTWDGMGKEYSMLIDDLQIAETCNSASLLERWMQ